MKTIITGFTIINIDPTDPDKKRFFNCAIYPTKKECIEKFIEDTSHDWKYWRDKYNYRCVKVKQTMEVI